MVTGLYAGLFALALIFLIGNVARLRMKHRVSLGTGQNEILTRASRAHGNFIETVPMALIVMAVAELGGAALWFIHVLGVLMVLGRISHYFGLTTGKGYGRWRVTGMVLAMIVYLLGGLMIMLLAAGAGLPAFLSAHAIQ